MKNKIKDVKEMYEVSGFHRKFIILFTIIISSAIFDVITIPYVTRIMINIEIPNKNIKALIIWGFVYVLLLLASCYLTLKHCNMRSILERKIQRNLREKVFYKMQEIKTKFYDDNETGVILQFLQTDAKEAGRMFADIITEMVFMGIIRFTIISIFLMFVDLKVALSIVLLYVLGYFVTVYFNKKTIEIINQIRKVNIELYSKVNEGIQGFLTIKILNIVKKKEDELNKLLEEYRNCNNKLEKNVAKYNNIFSFIISLSIPIIIYFSGMKVAEGFMDYVEIMLLIEFTGSLEFEFQWFIRHLTNFNKSFISFYKILSFLKSDNIEKIDDGNELEHIKSIEFSRVHFSYTGYEKNIENFNFSINKNEKLALVGRTGSGKTTIVNLLCRFYEPTKGQIKINGNNYLNYSISSLRRRIGYVMQDTYILPGTILDNIKYINKDITDEEIKNIFKKLKLHDKIMSLENGYHTDLNSNPDILSTGEMQMFNFARVMAINYDVVILDEVTSALSYESELLVNNAINEVTKDKMAIIVAHRLSTIKNCDKIILMNNGKIIEEGNHEDLLNRRGQYYALVNS